MNTTILGLDQKKTARIILDLNDLLANFQVYYQSLRGLHWNIKGKYFFELHVKFEEFYNDAQVKVDLIAERILTLEGIPLHTFQDYEVLAKVPVGKNISDATTAVQLTIDSIAELLKIERVILEKANKANDEGTNAMMSDFISEQEKTIWMLKAWMK
jgi:starvation-inducible DNA-binding protein